MTRRKILTVSAGIARPSSTALLASRIASRACTELRALGLEPSVETVDLREVAHPITDAMLTGFASGELARVLKALSCADGLILATPVFTAAYSGLLKSFLDVIETDALTDTPVLLAATGGTTRHSLAIDYAMRPVLTYLHADVVTTGVFAATDDWAGAASEDTSGSGHLSDRIIRGARELADKMARYTSSGPTDRFATTPDFAELLGE